jgi:SAM-dependent methyltransferase
MKKCPTCASKSVNVFYKISDLPLLLFPVDMAYKDKIVHDSIDSFLCEECFHIFTNGLPDGYAKLIYGDYYRFYPYDSLDSMTKYYREPFEVFFNNVTQKAIGSLEGRELLEIGCSSGEQLKFFNSLGYSSYGIDPSPLNFDENNHIISGYYEKYNFEKPFSIIVARFVLEHVENLDRFFKKVYKDLVSNGLLYLQVPNIYQFVHSGIPSFLAHEHAHYFNNLSLVKLANRYNFELIDISHIESQSIIAVFKKGDLPADEFVLNFDSYKNFLNNREIQRKELLNFFEESEGDVCFYGAGLMMTWMLYDSGLLDILGNRHIIDDNPLLNNKYFPNSNCMIISYHKDIVRKYKSILLTLNPVYHNDVVKKLRNNGYEGSIYALGSLGLSRIS